LSLQQICCNKLGRLIISLEWNKELVGFYRTSDFSFPNFVGVRFDWILMLIYWIQSLEKHTPLISGARVGVQESTLAGVGVFQQLSEQDQE